MMKRDLLLALPFAGGNSYSFNFLKPVLPQSIAFEVLEYPGRGARAKEALVDKMAVLIPDLIAQYRSIINRLQPERVILYGHSVGATVGIALLHALQEQTLVPVPVFAIFSGHGSPKWTVKKQLNKLSSPALIRYFEDIGAMSSEITAHEDMMDYILPILRNDLALYEGFEHRFEKPLSLPIAIINGDKDNIAPKDIAAWKTETTGEIRFFTLEGHHFFIRQYPQVFVALVMNLINELQPTTVLL